MPLSRRARQYLEFRHVGRARIIGIFPGSLDDPDADLEELRVAIQWAFGVHRSIREKILHVVEVSSCHALTAFRALAGRSY